MTASDAGPVAHGGETSSPIAKPLPSSIHVDRSRDETRRGEVAGLDTITFRAVIGAHRELLGMQRCPELKVYIAELDEIIETERDRRARRATNRHATHWS